MPDLPGGDYRIDLTINEGEQSSTSSVVLTVPDKQPVIRGPATATMSFADPNPVVLSAELGDGTCQQHTISVPIGVTASCTNGGAVQLSLLPSTVGLLPLQVILTDVDGDPSPPFTVNVTITNSLTANDDPGSSAAGNPPAVSLICVLDNDARAGQIVSIDGPIVPAAANFKGDGGTAVIRASGTANCSGDAYVDYLAPAGFVGTDTFDYTIRASGNQTSTAHVTIAVKGSEEFRDDLQPTFATCSSQCHDGTNPAAKNAFPMPTSNATTLSFYEAFCGSNSNPGPCADTRINLESPLFSLLYQKIHDPGVSHVGGKFAGFDEAVLQWINDGAYCRKDGTPCP